MFGKLIISVLYTIKKASVTQAYDINCSDPGSNKVGRFCNAIIVYNHFFCSLLKIHLFTLPLIKFTHSKHVIVCWFYYT